jgi:hypothetical protein
MPDASYGSLLFYQVADLVWVKAVFSIGEVCNEGVTELWAI